MIHELKLKTTGFMPTLLTTQHSVLQRSMGQAMQNQHVVEPVSYPTIYRTTRKTFDAR